MPQICCKPLLGCNGRKRPADSRDRAGSSRSMRLCALGRFRSSARSTSIVDGELSMCDAIDKNDHFISSQLRSPPRTVLPLSR
jgi:hypothetical protein